MSNEIHDGRTLNLQDLSDPHKVEASPAASPESTAPIPRVDAQQAEPGSTFTEAALPLSMRDAASPGTAVDQAQLEEAPAVAQPLVCGLSAFGKNGCESGEYEDAEREDSGHHR